MKAIIKCPECGREIQEINYDNYDEEMMAMFVNEINVSKFVNNTINDYGFTKKQKEEILSRNFLTIAQAQFSIEQLKEKIARKNNISKEQLHESSLGLFKLAE